MNEHIKQQQFKLADSYYITKGYSYRGVSKGMSYNGSRQVETTTNMSKAKNI